MSEKPYSKSELKFGFFLFVGLLAGLISMFDSCSSSPIPEEERQAIRRGTEDAPNLPDSMWRGTPITARDYYFARQFAYDFNEAGEHVRLAGETRQRYSVSDVNTTDLTYFPSDDSLFIEMKFTYLDELMEPQQGLVKAWSSGRGAWDEIRDVEWHTQSQSATGQ